MVHMLGQAVGACTNATHGMTLSAVSLAYYRYILPYGLDKMEAWMKKLNLVLNLSDLGVKEEDINDLVKSTLIMDGGYKVLNKEEIESIFRKSMWYIFRDVYFLDTDAEDGDSIYEKALSGLQGWINCFKKTIKRICVLGNVTGPNEIINHPEIKEAYKMGSSI